MSDININALSHAELKEQARILGIQISGNPSSDTLRKALADELGITAKEVQASIAKKDANKKQGWRTVMIPETKDDKQPVFVGHNGKSYRIRRGEPVEIPPHVLQVLRDAVQRTPDGNGGFRVTQSYNFQVLD